ncbi:signal peptidase I [Xanthomonas rydalmerensis]|uniref:Signal peptidase I n=1 Tax=Xanthomonas rydalmerensis TaxID=3046274 RepID=A0ABZ0JMV3_9XANT|nr:signal peptidase I [Xanthomonas sp. DM-2023]WOS41136.1 signal peptidase I [Xanthomonas sp. DM-2023]WOS45321.1 signal peptidase I [Xanthomonas sp. DM-2023]WOS49500.1 signal peptidase I [Xanthomonas sp. DM-2023]WOS53680.1 signal peptidase I [Xanthomonas sp. DM-2023]WOS57863.1 signal peptidase I [Xanthomonas sp. DM-2023]
MTPTDPHATRLQRAARWTRKELLPMVVMLLLLTAARSSFANHYVVPSGSMQPTLQPGDRVAVDMSAYGLRVPFTEYRVFERGRPQRGDVAVFDSPRDSTRLIKRVVAVAGDRVDVRDGHLSINGQPLQVGAAGDAERFGARIARLDLDAGGGPDLHDVRVPPGKLLVMGDHRGDSFDGRYFGFVDADKVYGKALAVFYRRGEGFEWARL